VTPAGLLQPLVRRRPVICIEKTPSCEYSCNAYWQKRAYRRKDAFCRTLPVHEVVGNHACAAGGQTVGVPHHGEHGVKRWQPESSGHNHRDGKKNHDRGDSRETWHDYYLQSGLTTRGSAAGGRGTRKKRSVTSAGPLQPLVRRLAHLDGTPPRLTSFLTAARSCFAQISLQVMK
jgi:hypothetical protein